MSAIVLCRICHRRPAAERVVFTCPVLAPDSIAHAVCDRCVDPYVTTIRELGWTVYGLSDIDDGPLGSTLGRAA